MAAIVAEEDARDAELLRLKQESDAKMEEERKLKEAEALIKAMEMGGKEEGDGNSKAEEDAPEDDDGRGSVASAEDVPVEGRDEVEAQTA